MSNKLTELTDRVLKEVIKNEVILPSTYREHFDNHAKKMNIDLNYEKILEEETEKRLEEAHDLMEKTHCGLDELEKTTISAQTAIKENDADKLALVMEEIEGLKSSIADLKGQLHTDTLTKLHNRKWMIEHVLSNGDFINEGILVFIDLDKFKPINDLHGHVIGDKVLQYLASFLKSHIRDMDIVRYAGDEFIVISNKYQMEGCYLKMKKIQEDLLSKKIKASNGELLHLSFSFGLTRFEKGSNFRDVLEIADSLMFENKKQKNIQRVG